MSRARRDGTFHVVAPAYGFACVVILLATCVVIYSFIEIRSGFWSPVGVDICPFQLLWLLTFTTACPTVQAVKRLPVTLRSCSISIQLESYGHARFLISMLANLYI